MVYVVFVVNDKKNKMQKIALYQALSTFEKKEWLQFQQYVSCPLFNTNKTIIKCLKYLYKHQDSLFELDSTIVFKHLFPEVPYDVQKLKDTRSRLFRLLKQFWVLQKKQDDDLFILQELRKRKLSSLYQSHYKALLKRQEPPKNAQYYYQKYLLIEEKERFTELGEVRQTKDRLQEMVDHLDSFYIIKKLKWSCEMLNRSRIVNTNYSLHLIEDIEKLIQQAEISHLQVPLIVLYHQVYLSLTQKKSEPYFKQLCLLLEKHVGVLSKSEAVSLYRYAQNYCIGKINKGENSYMQELFDIYKQLLSNELILENGVLAHPHYKNIVTLGLRLKSYDWIKNFIEDYQVYLVEHIRENAYHFNLATYFYETGDFNQVVQLLNSVEFTDVYYEISSKYILMKVYYDLEEFPLLSYLIISFERYIKRNKAVSSQNRQGILHFLMILKKLAKIKEWQTFKSDAFILTQKDKVATLLKKKAPIVNSVWLKQKFDNLI